MRACIFLLQEACQHVGMGFAGCKYCAKGSWSKVSMGSVGTNVASLQDSCHSVRRAKRVGVHELDRDMGMGLACYTLRMILNINAKRGREFFPRKTVSM